VTAHSIAELTSWGNRPRRRDRRRIFRRSGGLPVLALAAIGLAACGGGHSTPRVANLGTSRSTSSATSDGSSATTLPKGNPTELLDAWAACMRSHGDPNQADPTVTANKVIDITWDPATIGGIDGTNKGGQGNSGPGQYCRSYLSAAQTALGGNQQQQADPAQLEKFSQCMRASGVPDFPDPSPGGGLSIPVNGGGDLNPTNPIFHNASKLCAQKTGVIGFGSSTPRSGMIELNGAGPLPNG
jgi:hypothetical protein